MIPIDGFSRRKAMADVKKQFEGRLLECDELIPEAISAEDDNSWHESQMNMNMLIDKKIEEYVMSFTVHSLTKIMRGRKLESLFWVLMLMGSMLLSILVCYGLISKYLSHGIYTEIRSVVTDKNYFPSVTFCEFSLLTGSYFSYCGIRRENFRNVNNLTQCQRKAYVSNIETGTEYWSNGLFNVTKCTTWDNKNCLSKKFFKSKSILNNTCFIWNPDGNMYDIYSRIILTFSVQPPSHLKRPERITVIPHDHKIEEIDMTSSVEIEKNKSYSIKMDKTIVKRLQAPYPSMCNPFKTGDILPGKYNRRSCIESTNYINMYKTCGEIMDYIREFIPDNVVAQYKKNNTVKEVIDCIKSFSQGKTKNSADCRFPCEELELGIIESINYGENISNEYKISLELSNVDTYKVLEEKRLYTWDQLACEIGGFIGLVMGASVLSFVEIFVYIVLKTLRKFL